MAAINPDVERYESYIDNVLSGSGSKEYKSKMTKEYRALINAVLKLDKAGAPRKTGVKKGGLPGPRPTSPKLTPGSMHKYRQRLKEMGDPHKERTT